MKKILEMLRMIKPEPEISSRPQKGEAGQGLVEYALTLTLVSMALMLSLSLFGVGVKEAYCTVLNAIEPWSGVACEEVPGRGNPGAQRRTDHHEGDVQPEER